MKQQIEIAQVKILLTQKKIRNLHLRICPPDGEVRVSAPIRYSLAQISEFVLKKISWIKKGQEQIRKLRSEGRIKMPPKLVSNEEHYLFGKMCILWVSQNSQRNRAILKEGGLIELHVKGRSNLAQRQKVLDDFYRRKLREVIPGLIEKYEKKMGVKVAEFGIKKMKTRWGTCNVRAHRIWLNLELAKRPHGFLESIVVHEMVHLLERKHSKRFYELMDRFMPEWREIREKAVD